MQSVRSANWRVGILGVERCHGHNRTLALKGAGRPEMKNRICDSTLTKTSNIESGAAAGTGGVGTQARSLVSSAPVHKKEG